MTTPARRELSIVRAVLGDVATMRLGWTSAHEQLIARLPSWIEGPDLHMGFRPDPAYLLEVAATSVLLGFASIRSRSCSTYRTRRPDAPGRARTRPDAPGRAH